MFVCLRFVGRVQGVVKMQFRKTPSAMQDKVPDNEPSIDVFPTATRFGIFLAARHFSIHFFDVIVVVVVESICAFFMR